MNGTKDFEERRPSISFGSGRVCRHEGCQTVLSTYNPSVFCAVHAAVDEEEIPEGCMKCTACGAVYPWTTEWFHLAGGTRQRAGALHRMCKACRNARNVNYKATETREARVCPTCHHEKRLNTDNWYLKRNGGGWSSSCKLCIRKKNREHARKKASGG